MKFGLSLLAQSDSGLTFGEFVENQKQPNLVPAQENCFRYFGGVNHYVTIDNLKPGVKTAHIYDPEVNLDIRLSQRTLKELQM